MKIVPKGPPPDTAQSRLAKRLLAVAAPDVLQCPRCGCREMIETVTGATLVRGRLKGGARAVVCAGCHLKGERVVVA